MNRKQPRNVKVTHARWEIAKRVYGVVFLIVVIYVGINLLRG
jgi:hypothetical protein